MKSTFLVPHSEQADTPPRLKRESRGDVVWKDSALVHDYLSRVRRGVPLAHAQIDVMMRVIEGRGKQVRSFLDLGCGDGILAASILAEHPHARGVLVDFSTPMLKAALRNLKDHSRRLHFCTLDYADPAWFDKVAAHGPYDAIVSGYSIHHQPDDIKRQVYTDLFDLLRPEGVFLNMEHVASPSPWIEGLHDTFFIDSLCASQNGDGPPRTRDQIAAAYNGREDKAANVLAAVEVQCRWLRQIGFVDVDCYFKIFELALFGGRRPAEDPREL